MHSDIVSYHEGQAEGARRMCELLAQGIEAGLAGAEGRLWHGSPVWFLEGNPIVGYSVRKQGVQLLFWSGASFGEPGLRPEGKFQAAGVVFSEEAELSSDDLARWLRLAKAIQWDYQHLVQRKGRLDKLGDW